jgi:oxygen-dependent protoporphyrinogen oxidase
MISLVEKYFHSMLKFPNNVKPDLIRIFRHKHAIPQYELSTGERLNAINKLQRNYPGLTIAGNLRDGIGMAHRIKQAVDIANTL